MGIATVLRRNQGSISNITNAISQFAEQQRLKQNENRLRKLFTEEQTSLSPETTQNMDAIESAPESPVSFDRILNGTVGVKSPVPQTVRRTVPRGLESMEMNDILSVGSMMRESPELTPEVDLLQRAVAARKPQDFTLNAGQKRLRFNPTTQALELIAENPPPPKTAADKKQWVKRAGAMLFDFAKPGDEPIASPTNVETVRHNKVMEEFAQNRERADLEQEETDRAVRQEQEGTRLRTNDQERVTSLTDKNKELTLQLQMLEAQRDPKGNPMHPKEVLDTIRRNIRANQNEIARVHMKHADAIQRGGGTPYITLDVAREWYQQQDPNAEELKMSDEALTAFLTKNGYEVGTE